MKANFVFYERFKWKDWIQHKNITTYAKQDSNYGFYSFIYFFRH